MLLKLLARMTRFFLLCDSINGFYIFSVYWHTISAIYTINRQYLGEIQLWVVWKRAIKLIIVSIRYNPTNSSCSSFSCLFNISVVVTNPLLKETMQLNFLKIIVFSSLMTFQWYKALWNNPTRCSFGLWIQIHRSSAVDPSLAYFSVS